MRASAKLAVSLLLTAALSILACAGVVTAKPKAPARAPAWPVPELSSLERSTLDAVNDVREKAGLGRLVVVGNLVRLARAHSQDQARTGRTGHVGSDGTTPGDRARRGGVDYRVIAENVAMNQGYVDPVGAAVGGWMKSAGHKKNILNPVFTQTGVGVAAGRDGALYFTQVFLDPAPPG